jgi:hypothetical protein
MTPRVFERELEAARLRATDAYQRDLTLAWNYARCYALVRSKKGLPPLRTLLDEVNQSRGQSAEEMRANVELLSQMTGFPMRRAKK